MAVEIRLTGDQFEHYELALKKAKVDFTARGNVIEITGENYQPIKKAVKAAHEKSLNLKTKNVLHMERLFNLQVVIARLEDLAMFFPDTQKEVIEASC